MLIFWEARLVLLATPKTGSSAIESVLAPRATIAITDPPALKHTSLRRYRRHIAPFLNDPDGRAFTVVALMREPVDWLASWYRYRGRAGIGDAARSTAGMDFAGFVRAYMSDNPPEYAAVGAQSRFLDPGKGRPADHILRYEDMDSVAAFLQSRLAGRHAAPPALPPETPLALPRRNVSPSRPVDLPADLRQRLEAHLARDMALYHSLPGSPPTPG